MKQIAGRFSIFFEAMNENFDISEVGELFKAGH